ncbi:MAG: agmatinase [Saccharofermentanales bacterium]
MMKNKNVETFLGCDSEYDEAKIVVFGAPLDATSSFRPGSRFASSEMRGDSYGLETYSPYQDKDLADESVSVYDAGDLELPFGNPAAALARIETFVGEIYEDGKIPVMIGGEHLVSLASVKAALSKYPDLAIIHFDAHTDLRDEYLGQKLSHASVIRRIWELTGDNRIYSFGIRSGEKEEFEWSKEHIYMQRYDFGGLQDVLTKLKTTPVYLTIDLDVLDPSVFPGTGTPEPGGVSFNDLHRAVVMAGSVLRIVGADITELSPAYDQSGASTAVACKILRELLLVV